MSWLELFIVLIAAVLVIKPEQLPDIIQSVRTLYQTCMNFIKQQEKQITQSSQLEWLNKKMSTKNKPTQKKKK